MTPVLDPFMAGVKPQGLQKGRGGFLRSADDAPWVTDPAGEVCKTGDRKGEVKRLKYGSPSNRGREIENDAALVKYRQRLSFLGIGMDSALAEQCRDLVLLDADSDEFKSAADKIAVEADKLTRSWLAADRGTHGHLICELAQDRDELDEETIAAGEALGIDKATQFAVAKAWLDMLADNGLMVGATEASCVDDKWRLAGTLDRIVLTKWPLTFVKPGGELVTIPANTVLILDIKFGKCRLAHPIQIASYAQSVPYDTDTEERGVWPWPIDQTHALIAHGDFGDDLRPPSFELVWVDLVAGREHGGQCVVDAKAWAARDDVFSVAQIVEGANGSSRGPELERNPTPVVSPPSTPSPVPAVPAAGEGVAPPSVAPPSPALPIKCSHGVTVGWVGMAEADERLPVIDYCEKCNPNAVRLTVNDLLPRQGMPQHAVDELEVDRLNDARRQSYDYEPGINQPHYPTSTGSPWPLADPARLHLVDARASLCPSPDEGADWSDPVFDLLWASLRQEFDDLDPVARSWRAELAQQAKRRHVDFLAQGGRTERRYHLNRAVICLALAGEGDDILRELLAHIIGDVALMPGVEAGHALGSLNAAEAERFAAHVDAYLSVPAEMPVHRNAR